MVRPVSATRRRLPGGSFIWPYTIATLEFDKCVLVDDARLDHLVIEVVAFAGTLADAGEHRQTRVLLGDVVDQLEHVDGLAHAGAAEQADLAALGERHQQVDDLDAGDQQVLAAGLLVERRRRTVDRQVLARRDRAAVVLRRAEHVHDAAERGLAHRHRDRRAGGVHRQAALQAFGGTHGDGAHHAVAELLLHFERQVDVRQLQRLVDVRNRLARKLDVDDGADDLGNLALAGSGHGAYFLSPKPLPRRRRSPKAPW